MLLDCPKCGKSYSPAKGRYVCECGGVLLVSYAEMVWNPSGKGVWRYRASLPFNGIPVTMDEGSTGLVHSESHENVFFKLEGDNPTDSFKDRGTTVAISMAKGEGYKTVGVASTGNMGASVAAYAAHGKMKARVFVPAGTPREKVAQIAAYGAELVEVDGNFRDCVSMLWKAVKEEGIYLAETGLNPYYVEGEKTLGFELYEEMGVPGTIIVPMGTGGLTTAIFKAFKELRIMGETEKVPKMVGVQASGCSPIADAWRAGTEDVKEPLKGKTIASAIMVKSPFNGLTALRAIRESGGRCVTVTDAQIIAAMRDLGKEGVFAEPASAAALAAAKKIGYEKGGSSALIITGHGLKDPGAFLK